VRLAGAAVLATGVTASPASAATAAVAGGTLTTTYTHPFYDITQAAFTPARNLHVGDKLQQPGGRTAVITGIRLFHTTQTTYDLTINGLHTYYVIAGTTPVFVHNCGNAESAEHAQNAAQHRNGLRSSATNEGYNGDSWGTTTVIGVRNLGTGEISTRVGINGNATEAPNSWPQWAKDAFVPGGGHAKAGIINSLTGNDMIEFGGTSRNICWECYSQLQGPDVVIGGSEFPGAADKSPFRMFWREPGYPDNPRE
jgi:Pretoxin HINT domain